MVSLSRKLMLWLVLPQLVLWLAGGLATYRLAEKYANRAIDASLVQASRALLRQLKPIDQGLLIDFPRAAQDVLEADPNDRLMYTVGTPPGSFILGNDNLPAPPPVADRQLDTPYFYDSLVAPPDGASGPAKPMRIVALYVAFGDASTPKQTMLVQVARSSANRNELARAILADILLPLSVLVLLMTVIVSYGIRAGLAPLARLRNEVESRAPDDLTPLKLDLAPVELRSLAAALNDLLAAVQRQIGAQKRFISDAAHQLRTPLAGLQSQTKLALAATKDDEQRKRLEMVHQSATRSAHLVSQLLSLAHAEPEANAALPREPVDLRLVARDQVAQLVPRALRAGQDLGLDEGSAPVAVYANAMLLREALSNMIDNAIQYAGIGAVLTVRVHQQAGAGLLVVEDNGPGIPVEQQARVFERFVRATYGGNGCGLGLAIVKEIAERHQGTVRLETVQPRGLRVILSLPLASDILARRMGT